MSHETDVWIVKIKDVEKEYYAARFAVDRLLAQVQRDPTILTANLEVGHIRNTSRALEATYLMRLFAEFESGVRLYYRLVRKRRPPSKTEDLLNSVAARHGIPHEQLQNAHRVRDYRNTLVHERSEIIEAMTINEARGHLCRYLKYLPPHWQTRQS